MPRSVALWRNTLTSCSSFFFFFFFNDTATTEIYTLSLHDALPISSYEVKDGQLVFTRSLVQRAATIPVEKRSEEHTSELQSRSDLVCRLLLEKKKFGYKCAVYLSSIERHLVRLQEIKDRTLLVHFG